MGKTYVYKASAGSGKTFTLAREYVRLALSSERDDAYRSILAVTFTKKATGEMKERILRELYLLAKNPEKSKYMESKVCDGQVIPTLADELHITKQQIQERAQKALRHLLCNYTNFQVSTIDGFFQQVLRQFAQELSLPQLYNLSMDANLIIEEGVDTMLYDVRTHRKKERQLFDWLKKLVEQNIDDGRSWDPRKQIIGLASQMLTEEYQQKAGRDHQLYTNEVLQSYQKHLEGIRDAYIADIKKVQKKGLDIIENHSLKQEDFKANTITPFYQEYSQAYLNEGKSVCKKTMVKAFTGEDTLYVKKSTRQADIEAAATDGLLMAGQELIQLLGTPDALPARRIDFNTACIILKHIHKLAILMHVENRIMAANREQNRLPIGQVNRLINRIIENSDTPFIYDKLGTRIQHYMLDEFQDTSALQWSNFKPLLIESISQGHDNLIVGDVKQSIYRWRNSDWKLLQNLKNDVDMHHGIEEKEMKYNYRSSIDIVENNNIILKEYADYLHQSLGNTSPIQEAYSTLEQKKEVSTAAEMKQPEEELNEVKGPIEYGNYNLIFLDKEEAQESIPQRVVDIIHDAEERKVPLEEIAILCRQKTDIGKIATYLTMQGIAIQTSEGLRIQAHPAIGMLSNILEWLLHPDDAIIQGRISYHYYRYYCTKDKMPLSEEETWAKMQSNSMPWQELQEPILACRTKNLYELVQQIIQLLQLNSWKDATSYLLAFQDIVYAYASKGMGDLSSFMEYWKQQKLTACIPSAKQKGAVQLMTIHASKGLEFEIVIIPYLNWDIDIKQGNTTSNWMWLKPNGACKIDLYVPVEVGPSLKHSVFADAYQEEIENLTIDNLNVLYVALTRPKQELYAFGEKPEKTKQGTYSNAYLNTGKNLFLMLNERNMLTNDAYIKGIRLKQYKDDNQDDKKAHAPEYVYIKQKKPLQLRSRAIQEGEETINRQSVGTLMHDWLAQVTHIEDRDKVLQQMLSEGEINQHLAELMQKEWHGFWTLIEKEGHTDWYAPDAEVINEWTIMNKSNQARRPDRIVLKNNHATIIDYKFGESNSSQAHYEKQVREYMHLLQEMGYTTEGYLIYAEKQVIVEVDDQQIA